MAIILLGLVFMVRLFQLQVLDKSFEQYALNNAQSIRVIYPARGLIHDRHGRIMVYNKAAYDIMVTPRLLMPFDTTELCEILQITPASVKERLQAAEDYSTRVPSVFMKQVSYEHAALLQEKMFQFPGFYVQTRTLREYSDSIASHALGYVGEVDQGILVDDRMRSSVQDVWAAGDVAQAPGFFDSEKGLNPTLPNAVEQGRIAGMDMAQDPALKPFVGIIPMNTYGFFGHRAFAVGTSMQDEAADGLEVNRVSLPEKMQYQKLVLRKDRLIGASGIDSELDPGILLQLIRKRIDLQDVKQVFAEDPLGSGRVLMTKIWR